MRVFEPGELLSQVVARPSPDALYGLVYPELGIHLQKHVGVIRHDLHLDDLEGELVRDLAGYLSEAHVHSVHQHLVPVLGAEDHVVLAAVDDVIVALVFHADIMPPAGS